MNATTHFCDDARQIERTAGPAIAAGIAAAVAVRGRCNVAMSPAACTPGLIELLAAFARRMPDALAATHFFPADTASAADGRAAAAVCDRLAEGLGVRPSQLHFETAGAPDAMRAATLYEQKLRSVFALADGGLPAFDLVVLALGEDGTVAGLAPFGAALGEVDRLVVACRAPVGAARRPAHASQWITLTAPVLANARRVVVTAAGAAAARLHRDLAHAIGQPLRFPAQLLAAAGELILIAARPEASLPATWTAEPAVAI